MTNTRRREWSQLPAATRGFFVGTIVAGGLHAASSVYRAAGGTWLTSTLGEEAVSYGDGGSGRLTLIVVAALKVLAVAIPILAALGRLSSSRTWLHLSWFPAIGLLAYGLLHVVISALGLLGVFGEPENRAGLWGHALLWGPLFAIWGGCLTGALWREIRPLERRGQPHPQ